MSRLDEALEEYLALRRRLGFKLEQDGRVLPTFVAYLNARRTSIITNAAAVHWAQETPCDNLAWHARRLGMVRAFARHRCATDSRTEVPPASLIPFRRRRVTPHIYSDTEVAALMRAAREVRHPMTSRTYSTLIGLLVVTGLRVGEAIRLDDADIDWSRELLTVRNSKFGKSRLVPLHASTAAALRTYADGRQQLVRHRRSPSFFMSVLGTRLFYGNVAKKFRELAQSVGLLTHRGKPPGLHHLRHTFAVRTVRDWYVEGVETERRIPHLSTFLGHVGPSSTYWYLTATPELLTLASARASRMVRL